MSEQNVTNSDFQSLLTSLANEQTFELRLSDGTIVNCKQLTTSHLKELVQAVVDSPVTQAVFNSTITKVFKNSVLNFDGFANLSTLDRLLFILETRIQSLSPTKTVTNEDKQITYDLNFIKREILKSLELTPEIFHDKTSIIDNISLTYGVPLLTIEQQLNEELYKNLQIDVQNIDELRKLIGDAFINEIAKTIRTVTIGEQTIDLSTNTFKNRLKIVEKLPAKAIQDILVYIEQYKQIIDKCLTVDGVLLTIDGSLFSIR